MTPQEEFEIEFEIITNSIVIIDVTEFEYIYLGEGKKEMFIMSGELKKRKFFPTEKPNHNQLIMPTTERSRCTNIERVSWKGLYHCYSRKYMYMSIYDRQRGDAPSVVWETLTVNSGF